ncbi:hypothetical protein ATO6_16960 [Oceanicola sp. 22II-s10i]|uniref:invasion associated locus B family protein n=1 Tax=Oceanicola sp. 22II-s10i TaxID=1317116 RepID=UPI000B523ED5|nr:invasion associated locus B family protein [Oceanicola sp. 22II-s10i]OWU83567.1 hypothetical protein ATO6_16960 [Oceanicola sp. 22II-s10i]
MTRILSFLIALALAAPAVAQTTGETSDSTTQPAAEQPATEQPATEQPSQSGDLTMGTDDGEGAEGQPYTKAESGDWLVQCMKAPAEGADESCQLYQLLRDENDNPVAEFSLFRLPAGGQAAAGATVVVPLETALIEDMMLSVDGAKGKRYRFSFCNQVGCFARIGLTQADVDSLKRGKAATLTIVPYAAPDVKLALNLSLTGFTAGYDQITVAPGQQ